MNYKNLDFQTKHKLEMEVDIIQGVYKSSTCNICLGKIEITFISPISLASPVFDNLFKLINYYDLDFSHKIDDSTGVAIWTIE